MLADISVLEDHSRFLAGMQGGGVKAGWRAARQGQAPVLAGA